MRAAIERGDLDAARFEHYRRLDRELDENARGGQLVCLGACAHVALPGRIVPTRSAMRARASS